MSAHDHAQPSTFRAHCCPGPCHAGVSEGFTRRGFLGGMTLGSAALAVLSWSELKAADDKLPMAPPRRPLVVKPILTYATPQRQPQTSWRPWGGIQTPQDAESELGRIKNELAKLQATADFPLQILPPSALRDAKELGAVTDVAAADVVILYAAGGPANIYHEFRRQGKDVIFFVRHKSGPVSLVVRDRQPDLSPQSHG